VPEAGQGRGTPGWRDSGRLQLLQEWWKRRKEEYWRLGL